MHKNKKLTLVIFGWLMLFALQASAQNVSVEEYKINKRPLQDFSQILIEKWENDDEVLTKSFSVELKASLTKDGKIDTTKSSFTKSEGDEDIVNIAKSAIEAFGDSGWFVYLQNLGITDFNLTVAQNDTDFSINLISKMKSASEAKSTANGFNGIVKMAKLINEKDADVLNILNYSLAEYENSNIVLKHEMPKEIFQEMISRKLQEASKREKSPNG